MRRRDVWQLWHVKILFALKTVVIADRRYYYVSHRPLGTYDNNFTLEF